MESLVKLYRFENIPPKRTRKLNVHNWDKSVEVTRTTEKAQDIPEDTLCLFWCSGELMPHVAVKGT